jgi:hypothetical protein
MYLADGNQPLASWHDGPLVDAAYRVARSDEGAELQKIWVSRDDAPSTDFRAQ